MHTALALRPVLPADKERVLDFTRSTWGEHEDDYIAEVFDDWLADRSGEFTAALLEDQVVAIAKLTDLGDGEWWFEGLRVDPDFRRRGIGAALNRYHVELARRLGGKILRYMTGGENVGSQAIGTRTGFQHTLTFAGYLAKASADTHAPARLTPADLAAVRAWRDSALLRHQHGAYRDGWSVKTLTDQEIERVISDGRAFGLPQADGSIAAWAVVRSAEYDGDTEDGQPHRLRVDHLDGEPGAVIELARQLRGLAARLHRPEVNAGISDYAPLIDAVTQAGYCLNPAHPGLWIMELAL